MPRSAAFGRVRPPVYALVFSLMILMLAGCQSPDGMARLLLDDAARAGHWHGLAHVHDGTDTLAHRLSPPVDGQISADWDTPVPLASLTKVVVAVTVLQLVDEGRADLDLPLRHYRPGMHAVVADSITLRQLLAHRARLPRELGGSREPVFARMSAEGFAGPWLDDQPLTQLPGSDDAAHYSNLGYWLLGSVIEAVTDSTLHAVLRDRHGIGVGTPVNVNDLVVRGSAGTDREREAVDLAGRYASGGGVGTANAFLAMIDRAVHGDALRTRSRELLFTDFGYDPDGTSPLRVAAHLPGISHLMIADQEGRTVLLLNTITVDPLEAVLDLGTELAQVAGMEQAADSGEKQVFRTMDSFAESNHPLADAILALADAIGREDPESIEAVMLAHYDLVEFGPDERAEDLDLLPKLPGAMGGWAVRAWRVADEGDLHWIYLLMRTTPEVSDEDADRQFILGMAAHPEQPDKVFHVFYHFDGFRVR